MAFDFPDAPTVGDLHTEAGVEYQYAGNGVWNLAGGGAMTDYVLKAGDTMTGGLRVHPPGVGSVRLSPGDAGRVGMLEFFKADGVTRGGYIGWGNDQYIRLLTEGGMKWDVQGAGGGFLMNEGTGIHWGSTPAQTDHLNFSEGICMYGYGGTSQFGFTITSGTLNVVVQNTGNKIALCVGSEIVMDVRSDGVRIPGGNLNVTGNIDASGNIAAQGDLHATRNFDVDGSADIVGTTELRGAVNTRASFNAYGGVRLIEGQQLHFDGSKNEGEGQSVDMLFRKKGAGETWIEIAHEAADYASGGTDEAKLRFNMAQGGYGWSNAMEIQTGSVYCPRVCSAASFSDRGVAAGKSDIRSVQADEVNAAFAALIPRRFRKNEPDPVDYDGNPLPPLPQPKLRYGFLADEVYADPATKDIAVTTLHDEVDGTDIMQVLALTVAKLKLVEAELAQLKEARR